jgi:ATP-dependent exoDNAse (exonuclease V) alpha subunit
MRFNFKLHRTNTSVVRTQFPVLPAYAITCNRAQCQTLDFVGYDATVPVFSHGSLFVALSRARAAANVAIFVGSDNRALGDNDAASAVNVVYPELIKDALEVTARQERQQQQQPRRLQMFD